MPLKISCNYIFSLLHSPTLNLTLTYSRSLKNSQSYASKILTELEVLSLTPLRLSTVPYPGSTGYPQKCTWLLRLILMLDYLALTQLQILAFTSPKLSIVSSPDTCALAIFWCHASKNSKKTRNSGWNTSLITLYSYLSKPWYTRNSLSYVSKYPGGTYHVCIQGYACHVFESKISLGSHTFGSKICKHELPICICLD